MALNLLVTPPMTTFPKNGSAFADAIVYAATGGDLILTFHFIVDMGIIAAGIAILALVIHKNFMYKVLSIVGFIWVPSAFVNGARFAASNFTVDEISYWMAASFMFAFVLYLAMILLVYRDMAVKA